MPSGMTGVIEMSCQVMFIAKLVLALAGIGAVYVIFSCLKQDRLGLLAVSSIILYVFRARWKCLLRRSYWMGLVLVVNLIFKRVLTHGMYSSPGGPKFIPTGS